MNITLIHGDNEVQARNRFNELISKAKERGFEIIRAGFASNSLFSEKTLYVIENPKKLERKDIQGNLLILCDSDANLTLLKSLPKETKIEKFSLPKSLFSFLEKPNLKSFHELIKTEAIELVFAMIGRQFRDLYWVLSDPKSLNYPEWRASKLRNQADKFGVAKLKKIIRKLAEIDIQAKTSERDLTTSLDLLLASELE